MKILFLFCDMLRANLLKRFNPRIKVEGHIDRLLDQIGGTAFTNCYTPAPDTPRSLACLYSGYYPKSNGCSRRVNWPKYYLNSELTTIFDLLSEHQFEININVSKAEQMVGFLPSRLPSKFNIFNSPIDINNVMKEKINSVENTIYFINLDDYHWSMDDYGYTSLGDEWGQKHTVNYLNKLFDQFTPDQFDYIFLFSDHGCRLKHEENKSNLFLTDDNRTKIVMFIRKKGDSDVVVNDKLSCIMDILPTMNNILKGDNGMPCDGISFFNPNEHDNIVIEDHRTFDVQLDQVLRNWAIRTRDNFYFTNLEEHVMFKVCSANKYEQIKNTNVDLTRMLEEQIELKSVSYRENKKQYNILNYYKKILTERDMYSDGIKRPVNVNGFLFGLINRLRKNKHRRW